MIKSITSVLIIFFIFQQLKFQISKIDQNGYYPFCDETFHLYLSYQSIGVFLPLKTPQCFEN